MLHKDTSNLDLYKLPCQYRFIFEQNYTILIVFYDACLYSQTSFIHRTRLSVVFEANLSKPNLYETQSDLYDSHLYYLWTLVICSF